jgi:hypothetical protein
LDILPVAISPTDFEPVKRFLSALPLRYELASKKAILDGSPLAPWLRMKIPSKPVIDLSTMAFNGVVPTGNVRLGEDPYHADTEFLK